MLSLVPPAGFARPWWGRVASHRAERVLCSPSRGRSQGFILVLCRFCEQDLSVCPKKTWGGSKGRSWCRAGSGSVSLGHLRPLCSGFVPFRRDLAEGLGTSEARLSPVVLLSCSGQAGGVSEPPDTIFFALQSGQFNEDMIPTVGFNMRKITKGNVTIKVGHRKETQGGNLGMGQGQRQVYRLCWGLKEAAIRGICPLGCADTLQRRPWGWRRSKSLQQEPGCTAGGFVSLLAGWQGPADVVTLLGGGQGL